MSVASRSVFFNQSGTNVNRPIYNPVGGTSGGGTGSGSGELAYIDTENYNYLSIIDASYGQNMSNKNYELIPNDYEKYVQLYVTVTTLINKVTDSRLLLLLKLAQDTLVGAINSYAIYGSSIMCALDKVGLQNTINDILSGKNEKIVAKGIGQLSITKKFKLARVFNNYIVVFGMPAFGVGFDPQKIKFLADILQQNGIDPYK